MSIIWRSVESQNWDILQTKHGVRIRAAVTAEGLEDQTGPRGIYQVQPAWEQRGDNGSGSVPRPVREKPKSSPGHAGSVRSSRPCSEGLKRRHRKNMHGHTTAHTHTLSPRTDGPSRCLKTRWGQGLLGRKGTNGKEHRRCNTVG